MAQPQLMMFKLVTGEQIISLVERISDQGRWSLIHPRLVISRWNEGKDPIVGGPWVPGITYKADGDVPLDYKHALLVYYGGEVSESLKAQYAHAVSR